MYECFHCLALAVIWDCDYSFEDFGYPGEGIVQMCHCENCGAEIEYRIPFEKEEDDSQEEEMVEIAHVGYTPAEMGYDQ